jgi:hypothetical protein
MCQACEASRKGRGCACPLLCKKRSGPLVKMCWQNWCVDWEGEGGVRGWGTHLLGCQCVHLITDLPQPHLQCNLIPAWERAATSHAVSARGQHAVASTRQASTGRREQKQSQREVGWEKTRRPPREFAAQAEVMRLRPSNQLTRAKVTCARRDVVLQVLTARGSERGVAKFIQLDEN